MKYWEYTYAVADSPIGLLPRILHLGRHGWELVSVVVEPVENEMPKYVAILKSEHETSDGGPPPT